MYNNSLVEVIYINENAVLVSDDDTFNEFSLDLNEARNLIQNYLG